VIGEYGSLAIRENLLSRAAVFQLTRERGNEIIDEVQQIVRAQWRVRLAERDVSPADIQEIANCFDPPSFETPAPQQARL
jgi:hypothetical protein